MINIRRCTPERVFNRLALDNESLRSLYDFFQIMINYIVIISIQELKIYLTIFIFYCKFVNNNILMAKYTGRLAGFDPSAYANDFVTSDEVLEIKKAFDLFDYDGGGSIDPKGTLSLKFQNLKKASILLVLKQKLKLYGT